MRDSRLIWVSGLILWLCGGCNQGLANRVTILEIPPDFLLVGITLIGLMGNMRGAIIAGFIGGVIQGAIVGADMWQFVLTRIVIGVIAAFAMESRFQRNPGIAGITAAVSTVISGIIFLILTGHSDIGTFVKATIISAMYNGVLAMLAYVPVERATGAQRSDRL